MQTSNPVLARIDREAAQASKSGAGFAYEEGRTAVAAAERPATAGTPAPEPAPGGSGTRAAIDGYRVAGKTGTARKSGVGGYSEDRHTSVFAGFAPASDPALVIVVVIDDPRGDVYYGGDVAAPVFAEIAAGALRLLAIAPDAPNPAAPPQMLASAG
ncbi:MAG: penicillin-binding transpeptidase domain-containing protein, partial [Candidatus Nanopelagicales bacterium]